MFDYTAKWGKKRTIVHQGQLSSGPPSGSWPAVDNDLDPLWCYEQDAAGHILPLA